ncbi:helix-turn-helix transcriptional regulator [Amycolatopsis lurida]|nr:LuxR C-terminal-related transcriptional regulator [Amycolatopsis lurida]
MNVKNGRPSWEGGCMPDLGADWPGLSGAHAGGCQAEEALTLVVHGTDRLAAVQLAGQALAGGACSARARCLWRAITVFLCAGELVAADAQLQRLEGACDDRVTDFVAVLRAQHARLIGDLSGALTVLTRLVSAEVCPFTRRLAMPFLADVLVAAGKVADAEAMFAELDFDEVAGIAGIPRRLLLAVRGSIHLAMGQPCDALEDLLACLRLPATEPSAHFAVMHSRGLAALAARAAGRVECATDLAEQEQEAALAWGSPAYVGWALYVRAVTADTEGEIGLLVDAIDLLEVAQSRVVLTAAAHELGLRLVRAGDGAGARRELERAGQWAVQIGNEHLATKIHTAWRDATQSDPSGSLTSQEAKIAELARAGYSNKQIAESLYLTVRTIEFHLSNVYRKLKIASRRELMNGTTRQY